MSARQDEPGGSRPDESVTAPDIFDSEAFALRLAAARARREKALAARAGPAVRRETGPASRAAVVARWMRMPAFYAGLAVGAIAVGLLALPGLAVRQPSAAVPVVPEPEAVDLAAAEAPADPSNAPSQDIMPPPSRPAELAVPASAAPRTVTPQHVDAPTLAARRAAAARRLNIPKGHRPAPGTCRHWFPGRPPGHQPPPTSCTAPKPRGAVLVKG